MIDRVFLGLLLTALTAASEVQLAVKAPMAPVAADVLPADSVWLGTQEQADRDGATQVVLWIQSRDEDTYEATMWYPKFGNGLIRIRGRIDAKAGITLDSDEVIYGKNFKSGATSAGRLTKDALTCKGKFRISEDAPAVEVTYKLKRIR